jgi:hypothetical protein
MSSYAEEFVLMEIQMCRIISAFAGVATTLQCGGWGLWVESRHLKGVLIFSKKSIEPPGLI